MTKIRIDDLHALLTQRGPLRSREIVSALEISRPTLKRLVDNPSSQVISVGNTHNSYYAMPWAIPGLESPVQIFEIEENGLAQQLGELHPVKRNAFLFVHINGQVELHLGLPAWVEDMRPQGYLGRGFAAHHPDLHLPSRLTDWSGEHMLIAIARRMHDGPGNLVVGKESFARFTQRHINTITESDLQKLAEASANINAGSSAGGEYPKFTGFFNEKHVIIKFARQNSVPINQRWNDLLVCEHIALQTLSQFNVSAAKSQIIDCNGYRFLIIDRFDRVGPFGRIGMLSMQAIHDGYISKSCANWIEVAQEMVRIKILDQVSFNTIELLTAYSVAIGNTDRHFGNISFLKNNDRYCVAPAYDVLPIALQAIQDRLPSSYEINLSQVPPARWGDALHFAFAYWASVIASELISPDFKLVANASLIQLREVQTRYGLSSQ